MQIEKKNKEKQKKKYLPRPLGMCQKKFHLKFRDTREKEKDSVCKYNSPTISFDNDDDE